MRQGAGLTLLELLTVVILIAILASIAIPNFSKMVEKAKVRDAEATLNMIYQAQRIYRLDQTPPTYGTLANLVDRRYLPNPNRTTSCPPDAPPIPDWCYSTLAATATKFTAQATRQTGSWAGNCLKITELGNLCREGYKPPLSTAPACSKPCGEAE